jgi:dipeptidyl aminopeptidase/acylaminoacyl peptidase
VRVHEKTHPKRGLRNAGLAWHKKLVMKRLALWIASFVASFSVTTSFTAELPVETFFRNYSYREALLSPEGDYLAALAPDKNRVGLAVIDLKTLRANWAFGDRGMDVAWFRWANNERLLLRLAKNGHPLAGLLGVNRDGSKRVNLVSVLDPFTSLLALLPRSKDEILVTSMAHAEWDQETGFYFANVERMNILTGAMKEEVKNPGHVVRWVLDHNSVVRVGIAVEGLDSNILYRDTGVAPWRSVGKFAWDDPGGIEPVCFDYDNQTLLVRSYGGEQMGGIYTFDPQQKKTKTLAFRHAEADAENPILSDAKRAVVGVAYETQRPEVFWFDPQFKAMQEMVDRALPGTLNQFVSVSRGGQKRVVLATNDRTPGTFHLLDTQTMKMEKLFDLADWIHPEEMAEMKPIEYKARDGLLIHGYLTIPKGSNAKSLPLIVNPHGGPIVRDSWGFDPEVQFLANRGYAVLRMNFRGSPGYGWDFMRAGFKEWGSKQQNDITDGVKWAIEQGIADPKRICICGASYGGYAALIGLEQTPELYRCGISYVGVTDVIRTLKKMELRELDVAKAQLAQQIGDRKAERDRLEAISPINQVDKIQVPVFLANGELDPKVPISTGRDMARALRKRGKLYDFMVKDDEGHGFFKEENKIEFWKKVDEFLKANMN